MPYCGVPIVAVHGHVSLRENLLARVSEGTLPASVLLHGPAGIGKQRLALWLGQVLLCESKPKPCGACQHCRYALELTHPDLHWIFPRPRLKDSDASPDDIAEDIAAEVASRVQSGGIYARPGGAEGIFVATVRMILRHAALAPALAHRKVFVIGDAERMVPQEGADQAANAFLKLLEEPAENTHIILTSSEPASLLPTIRSRVVALRVSRLSDAEVRAFAAEPAVARTLSDKSAPAALTSEAGGAPGRLFGSGARATAIATARKLVDAGLAPSPEATYEIALTQNVGGARGAFAETLEALTWVLAERLRDAARSGDTGRARTVADAMQSVESAKEHAGGNVNPQLLTWRLLRDIRGPR